MLSTLRQRHSFRLGALSTAIAVAIAQTDYISLSAEKGSIIASHSPDLRGEPIEVLRFSSGIGQEFAEKRGISEIVLSECKPHWACGLEVRVPIKANCERSCQSRCTSRRVSKGGGPEGELTKLTKREGGVLL
jgi:hypothetical protein